ncbi:MAG: hypothetical protein HRU15_12480 [Planctomycetes bacterium]|nr:hypothetical protein [Planctomycetota bacterium]
MLFPPKPKPFNTKEEFGRELEGIPGRNERARLLTEEPGKYVVLEVDLKYGPIVKYIAKTLKARDKKKVQLDGLSLEIYDMIDGVHNIGYIIETLIERHKLSFFEARGLCLYYMQIMSGNGIVAIGILQDESTAVAESTDKDNKNGENKDSTKIKKIDEDTSNNN